MISTETRENAEYLKFLKECYRKYQLKWMTDHGYSIADLISLLSSELFERVYRIREDGDEDCLDDGMIAMTVLESDFLETVFKDWEMFTGFTDGDIWVCEEEFEDNEFQDYDYMQYLLSQRDFNTWKTFVEES